MERDRLEVVSGEEQSAMSRRARAAERLEFAEMQVRGDDRQEGYVEGEERGEHLPLMTLCQRSSIVSMAILGEVGGEPRPISEPNSLCG